MEIDAQESPSTSAISLDSKKRFQVKKVFRNFKIIV